MTTNQIFNIAEDAEAQQQIDLEFLERMDFTQVEANDPSTKNDFRQLYQRTIPCHIELDYHTSSQYMQTQEQLNFRILINGEEHRPWAVRFELSTEADVQLFYACTISNENYMMLQMENDLSVDWEGFTDMIKSLLNDCLNNPVVHQTSFTMENDEGVAFFRFFHNSEYRKSQILSLTFKQLDDEEINEQVSYRIKSTEKKAEMIAARIQDINEIIRKAVAAAGKEQGLDFDANALLM